MPKIYTTDEAEELICDTRKYADATEEVIDRMRDRWEFE